MDLYFCCVKKSCERCFVVDQRRVSCEICVNDIGAEFAPWQGPSTCLCRISHPTATLCRTSLLKHYGDGLSKLPLFSRDLLCTAPCPFNKVNKMSRKSVSHKRTGGSTSSASPHVGRAILFLGALTDSFTAQACVLWNTVRITAEEEACDVGVAGGMWQLLYHLLPSLCCFWALSESRLKYVCLSFCKICACPLHSFLETPAQRAEKHTHAHLHTHTPTLIVLLKLYRVPHNMIQLCPWVHST